MYEGPHERIPLLKKSYCFISKVLVFGQREVVDKALVELMNGKDLVLLHKTRDRAVLGSKRIGRLVSYTCLCVS